MIDTLCESDLKLMLKNLSHQHHKILLLATSTSHKVAILSDGIIVDDGWSEPWTFLQQTVKQFEVIREVVFIRSNWAEWLRR